jgi:Ca2+-binding RTX toxin-like protein
MTIDANTGPQGTLDLQTIMQGAGQFFGAPFQDLTFVNQGLGLQITFNGLTAFDYNQILNNPGFHPFNSIYSILVQTSGFPTTFVESFNGFNIPVTTFAHALNDYLSSNGADHAGLDALIFNASDSYDFHGNIGNDLFHGGSGNDTFRIGQGEDTAIGGEGNDFYIVDRFAVNPPPVHLVELPNGGLDQVQSNLDFVLPDNIENLTLVGMATTGTGNAENNLIIGNIWDNTLKGADGADTLTGAEGVDILYGGNGGDTLYGGAQDDTLYGEGGNDFVSGGDGVDLIYGGGNDDTLNGDLGADQIFGGDGNDIIDGGAGVDFMVGGFGSDTYYVDETTDVIVEDDLPAPPIAVTYVKGTGAPIYDVTGYDKVYSTATYTLSPYIEFLQLMGKQSIDGTGNEQDNLIIGNTVNNVIRGMGGDDFIDGMGGNDTDYGGQGDDTFVVYKNGDTTYDTVIELADEGHDLVLSWVTYVLPDNVEDLTLIGTDSTNATGNELDNKIIGNAGANRLDGKTGDDYMAGGGGNDTYVIDSLGDVAVENGGQGIDTIETPFTTTLDTNFENLTLTGVDAIDGTGNASANVILGNDQDNVIDGLTGADTMAGKRGDDTYFVDNAGDTVTETAGQGYDIVNSTVSFTLSANVEELNLLGSANINGTGNDLNNLITGNSGANVLDGKAGADTMQGGGGNDTYIVDNAGDIVQESPGGGVDLVKASITYTLTANVENLTLTGVDAIDGVGNHLNNTITGNAANNVLDGGGAILAEGGLSTESKGVVTDGGGGILIDLFGHDTLIGGMGDDTYIIRRANDVVKETAGQGTDTAVAWVSYTLASNVENLVLAGEAGLSGTGNSSANVITGNDGDNTLDGKAGADALIGGQGNDTYVVDNVGDVVIEDPGAGIDTVLASVSFTLGANVENLSLTGPASINGVGNDLDNVLTGNTGANILDGGTGADTMAGGVGNDGYIVDNLGDQVIEQDGEGTDTVKAFIDYALGDNVERLVLAGSAIHGTGNELDNVIGGNALNNVIDGGLGADLMAGGLGHDTYYVDNTGDIVQEAAGGGNDLVYTTLNSYILPANVEELVFQGSGDFTGVGNNLGNAIYGGVGNDTLDGKGGIDILGGHAGDDTYVVDNAGDLVQELAGEGHDTVITSVTYTLASEVEDIYASGVSSINLTGNGLDNLITGNGGNNTLNGLGGNDTLVGKTGNDILNGGSGDDVLIGGGGIDQLTGGGGADTFLFGAIGDLPPSPAFDVIVDFSHSQGDIIDLAGIDANTGAAGNQAFAFIGTHAFTHTAGELRYATFNGYAVLGGDIDGDGTADFFIKLMGVTTLTGSDFHP